MSTPKDEVQKEKKRRVFAKANTLELAFSHPSFLEEEESQEQNIEFSLGSKRLAHFAHFEQPHSVALTVEWFNSADQNEKRWVRRVIGPIRLQEIEEDVRRVASIPFENRFEQEPVYSYYFTYLLPLRIIRKWILLPLWFLGLVLMCSGFGEEGQEREVIALGGSTKTVDYDYWEWHAVRLGWLSVINHWEIGLLTIFYLFWQNEVFRVMVVRFGGCGMASIFQSFVRMCISVHEIMFIM